MRGLRSYMALLMIVACKIAGRLAAQRHGKPRLNVVGWCEY
mgnify:CR=1 FL=1|jgi:hypothetical protein